MVKGSAHRGSLTQHRDLRTGESVWSRSWGLTVPCVRLRKDVTCDVAVVGAGISGALMALKLTHMGQHVAVVDRRAPIHGSTMASTSLLQFEVDVPLSTLSERIGPAKARRAWRRSVRAVQELKALVRHEQIRCGMVSCRSLYLAGDAYGARALAREARARARAGISGRFLDHDALWRCCAVDRAGAIMSSGNAVGNPAQLTAALLRRASSNGAHIYSPADVIHVAATTRRVELSTAGGATITASHAVFCTGYELLTGMTVARHSIKSTWAIATHSADALPKWLDRTVVWEASDPYLYMRTTSDGRVIAGGEDEASATRHTNRRLLTSKSAAILRKVQALVPGATLELSHCWAGAFGESSTGLPTIDRVAGMPRCHAVTGFGGNGITYSLIASAVVSRSIAGVRDSDADLYRAPR